MPQLIFEKSSLRSELPNVQPGFGDYDLPAEQTFAQMQSASRLRKISLALLFGSLGACSLFLFSLPLAILPLTGFLGLLLAQILGVVGISNRAPSMGELFPPDILRALPQIGAVSSLPCRGFPTKNGPESFDWKLELIKTARHSIILSGCYCGDQVFEETMDLMQKQMRLFPALKIYILASDSLITPENQEHIDRLRVEFPERFTCLITPELFPMISPVSGQLSISSNHCKMLVIDGGAYFMLGGTGITHSFSEQRGLVTPKEDDEESNPIKKVMDSVLRLRAFRDMDFVFHSPLNGIGTRLHVEMMKLFERMRFRQEGTYVKPDCNWGEWPEATATLFQEMERVCNDLKVSCYASGPEQEGNAFLEALIEQVERATESIVIAHMYFHPPKRLLEALIRAVNRNVKMTILMNKYGTKSPGSHSLYAHRSKYHAGKLYEGKPKENIELYEFAVPFTSLHKKVVVIDGKFTLFGSANMGKKSLENLDYEVNLCVESAEFAAQVLGTIQTDLLPCKKIPASTCHQISLLTRLLSPIQILPMLIV